jgi:PrtD family type I secretion system ABC transporter
VSKGLQISTLLRLAGGSGLAIILFSLIVNLLMLTGPLFMLQIYDRVLTSGSIPTLLALSGLVVLLYLLYGFLEFVRSRMMGRLGACLDADIRDRAFQAITFHAVKGDKSVRTAPLSDLAQVRQFLAGPGPFAFLDAPWTPIYLLFIYLMHPVLGVASIVAVALLAVLAIINNLVTRKASAEAGKIMGRANAAGEEARRNAEVTTALGMGPMLRSRWSQLQDQALAKQMTASDRGGMISAMSRTLRFMFQSGILGLGAWLAVNQEISPGTMIAASIIMSRALAPVEQMVAHWQGFLTFRESWGRLSTVLKGLPENSEGVSLPDPVGHIKVEGLTAGLPQLPRPMLANVTFELKPGEGLGIIGPTGAGKSTLARILVGVWPYYRGAVRLNGAELSQYEEVQLGRSIGYLPQDVELYDGTIGQNIARFDAQAPDDAIIDAARKADVHELILSFPEGYDTAIGEGGALLSAGQRQRIGLARALYGNPALVVLDEPNANLDAAGEAAVVAAVQHARQSGSTVIIIAHRPSAIAALDQLMMLREGRVIALGPKEEVLEKVTQKAVGPAVPIRNTPKFQSMGMSMNDKPEEAAE